MLFFAKLMTYIDLTKGNLMNKNLLSSAVITVSMSLTACGGDSSSNDTDKAPQTSKSFATTANEFTADFSAATEVCYDLETQTEIQCSEGGSDWDLKFKNNFTIELNGAISGSGNGGAFGPKTYAELAQLENGSAVENYDVDTVTSVIDDKSWYGYGFLGQHKLWPNYRVYAVDTNDQQYKLRITGYYDSTGSSGFISFDYQDITSGSNQGVLNVTELDASAGGFGAADNDPANKFTYYNLSNNAVVELTDKEAITSTAWDVAFKRNDIKFSSNVQSALAFAQNDFYDAEGEGIADQFTNVNADSELDHFLAVDQDDLAELTLETNKETTALLGYNGWYSYNPTTHTTSANDENHWVIRSANGSQYAIFNVTDLATAGRGAASYTVNFYHEEEK
jgi:hypothetical protein